MERPGPVFFLDVPMAFHLRRKSHLQFRRIPLRYIVDPGAADDP